jgi:hypothetical protein
MNDWPFPEAFLTLESARKLRCDNLIMPISMGILCERCRTVYFISRSGKSANIHYDRIRGEFRLSCIPPCPAVSYFHRTMLRPYSVAAEGLLRGHADVAECHMSRSR